MCNRHTFHRVVATMSGVDEKGSFPAPYDSASESGSSSEDESDDEGSLTSVELDELLVALQDSTKA